MHEKDRRNEQEMISRQGLVRTLSVSAGLLLLETVEGNLSGGGCLSGTYPQYAIPSSSVFGTDVIALMLVGEGCAVSSTHHTFSRNTSKTSWSSRPRVRKQLPSAWLSNRERKGFLNINMAREGGGGFGSTYALRLNADRNREGHQNMTPMKQKHVPVA